MLTDYEEKDIWTRVYFHVNTKAVANYTFDRQQAIAKKFFYSLGTIDKTIFRTEVIATAKSEPRKIEGS